MKPAALLWDYDGTLVDSAVKNRIVTIGLLHRFDPQIDRHLPAALRDVESYRLANIRWKNWRELYSREYGLTEEQIDEAGRMWTRCQMADPLAPPLFCGLRDVLPELAASPMGICSQNGSENIRATLSRYGVDECFSAVVGHEDVPFTCQKPDPAGFLVCLEKLGVRGDEGPLFYIGDHREDVHFAHLACEKLRRNGISARVFCIEARFGDHTCRLDDTGADACVTEPGQLPGLIDSLCSRA